MMELQNGSDVEQGHSASHVAPMWVRLAPRRVRERMASRTTLVPILNNAGWLAADKVIRMVLGLVVGVMLARLLGPHDYGVLSFALALVTLFGACASLGLDAIAVRELVRSPSSSRSVIGTVFVLKLMGTATAGILIIVVALALRPGDTVIARLSAIIALGQIFLAFDAIGFWFQSRLQSRYAVVAKSGAFIILSGVRIALISRGAPLEAFAWAAAAEYVLAGLWLAGMYFLTQRDWPSPRHFNREMATSLLRSSWPLLLSGVMIVVYMRIDQVMLAAFRGDAEVGTYSVAVRLAEAWYFVPGAIASSTLPAFLRSKEGDPAVYRGQTQRLFQWMAIVGYAVALAMTFAAGPLISVLYGAAYANSVVPLIVLAWAGLFVCLGVARENWMLSEGLMKLSFATTAWGAIVNILLNFALIPRWGSLGAAIATLIAQIVAVTLSTLLYAQTRPVFRMQINALTAGFAARWPARP